MANNKKRKRSSRNKKSIKGQQSTKPNPLNEDCLEKDRIEEIDKLENEQLLNSGDDSDTEGKPVKKKKKKKATVNEQSEPGKKNKSIRQMKKEKFTQRQADAEAFAKDSLKKECLSYLSQWKHAKEQWKFMKIKQVWLYKNKFSSKLVPDEFWKLLLEYFDSAKGNIRSMLLDDANKIIKLMDDCIEKGNCTTNKDIDEECDELNNKPDDISYKRARDIIQHLQE